MKVTRRSGCPRAIVLNTTRRRNIPSHSALSTPRTYMDIATCYVRKRGNYRCTFARGQRVCSADSSFKCKVFSDMNSLVHSRFNTQDLICFDRHMGCLCGTLGRESIRFSVAPICYSRRTPILVTDSKDSVVRATETEENGM